MVISHSLKCIFIHIQKIGGSSIEHVLTVADPEVVSNLFRRHVFARQLQAVLTKEIWESYFKFAFVRNPWERLVSWHAMCLQRPGNDFQRHIFEKYSYFDDFIEHAIEGMAKRLSFNQLDYICNAEGDVIVDFVGRTEKFKDPAPNCVKF